MSGDGEADVRASVNVSNYDDRDPISLELIADLLRGGGASGDDVAVFKVDMGGGKTHAYDADAWLTHLTTDHDDNATTVVAGTQHRRQGHVTTRQQLRPSEIWACFSAVFDAVLDAEGTTGAENDPRIAKCLSVEIVGKRSLLSVDPVTRKGRYKVTLAPVSPLFNMRVRRMAKVGEGYAAYDDDDLHAAQPTQCYRVAYNLVDSRDSTRVVGPQEEREVQIMCPVGDVLAVI